MSTPIQPQRIHQVAPCDLADGLALATFGAAHAQTTMVGTLSLTSQPNPAITSDADTS